MKYRTINEKPTEASPETNEQFVLHALEYSNHAEKLSFPPNSIISFGLALPQKPFNNTLTIIIKLKKTEEKIKTISFKINLKPKKIFFIGIYNEKTGQIKI